MAIEPGDPPDRTDADIEATLRAAPADQWAALWALVDSMAPVDTRATWSREGWATYTVTVEQILGLWSTLAIVQPVDWIAWGGLRKYPRGEGLDDAPVAEAVRLATAIVRADRFNEGTLEMTLQDGTFSAVHRRLRRWREGESADPGGHVGRELQDAPLEPGHEVE